MEGKTISDYTESEFLELVRKLFNVEDASEEEDIQNLLEFERLCEHPDGTDIIFYPNSNQENTPERLVKEINHIASNHIDRLFGRSILISFLFQLATKRLTVT
ncbi:bacteriocin immunity protein [Yersinia artesiana]|uniref:bacteriocin immunity protein n=1 Tax=Yersinia artesiana TaxID=2890315 RepID=UPI0015815236|nr:bacteriocin immunity protein [Yersinia artesiana]